MNGCQDNTKALIHQYASASVLAAIILFQRWGYIMYMCQCLS